VIVDPEPREKTRWIDWAGNLEVSPPVTDRSGVQFPFGRVLSGVQFELGFHPEVLSYLEGQGTQTPGLLIDTSWLTIGHVDEVVNFIPADDELGFRVLMPSPSLACELSEKAVREEGADTLVFAGKTEETTIAGLLAMVTSTNENANIEKAIAVTQAQLLDGLGLQEKHFVFLPALFRNGLALIPNPVNSLVCNRHVIVPDPAGPEVEGKDLFASYIQNALNEVGNTVHFVDIWEPYHVAAGEIHCGTNAVRRLTEETVAKLKIRSR
jgi:protein-arginine deiminase